MVATSFGVKGCEMRMVATDPAGKPLGEPIEASATWWELRNHGATPADATEVRQERIEVPAGEFDCWLYAVTTDGGQLRMWFDQASAGSPVLMTETSEGIEVRRMELLETNRRPLEGLSLGDR